MAGKGNGVNPNPVAVQSSAAKAAIREAIINHESAKRQSRRITFYGQELEIRQPLLAEILAPEKEKGEGEGEGERSALLMQLIHNAYVPDTEELVFDETDADWLLSLPFGNDFENFAKNMRELTTLNFPAPSQSSKPTSTSEG